MLGTESVVPELANGKRPLSKANTEKLSRRFHVSPAVFFPRMQAGQLTALCQPDGAHTWAP